MSGVGVRIASVGVRIAVRISCVGLRIAVKIAGVVVVRIGETNEAHKEK